MTAALILLTLPQLAGDPPAKPPSELRAFLKAPDKAYKVEAMPALKGSSQWKMTSQIWQGKPWQHSILWREPSKSVSKDTAILFITGDGPLAGDFRDLTMLSEATQMPIAMLFDIPNQPTFGMKEDDLIAHTFEKYIETRDARWPLLFPMTKAAFKAMDAVQKISKGRIKRFIVTGASKRGWTTWMVGVARDNRVIGIAPLVYDNLNVKTQMAHQLNSWGKYSDQIQDYTRRGLQSKLDTPVGKKLASLVDPFSYLLNLKAPVMVVNGANDPYWAADALSLYWKKIPTPHYASLVPNAGHDLGSKFQAVGAVGAFARSLVGEFKMPVLDGEIEMLIRKDGTRGVRAKVNSLGIQPVEYTIWEATAPNLDFRPSTWHVAKKSKPATKGFTSIVVPEPGGKAIAILVEAKYKVKGREFLLSLPIKVFPKVDPEE